MNKRLDILDREEDIRRWIAEKKPKSFICAELDCKPSTLDSYLNKMGIKYSGNSGLRGYCKTKQGAPIELYLNNEKQIKSSRLKSRLIKEHYKECKCERCGLVEWQGAQIPLELHHNDGNRFNNNLSNLTLLCPNCHALTDNYRGKNTKAHKENFNKKKKPIKIKKMNYCVDCHRSISLTATRCKSCSGKEREKEKIEKRPSREELKELIRTMPFLQIGKKFGVSDNAIRKWCKNCQLPSSPREIKKYSDEEWKNI